MRYFIDQDGVLAVWKPCSGEESLYSENFFLGMRPHAETIVAVKKMIQQGKSVYLLSKYLSDSEYALREKNLWLDKYLPELAPERRIFVPQCENKSDYVLGGIQPDDVLLDDYSENLREWEAAGGIGVKLMTGANGTKGTWTGKKVPLDRTDIVLFMNQLSNGNDVP